MLRDVPWQQFVDAVGLVIRNVCKNVFKVGAWVDVVQFARADQAIHRGGSLTTAIHRFDGLSTTLGTTPSGRNWAMKRHSPVGLVGHSNGGSAQQTAIRSAKVSVVSSALRSFVHQQVNGR